MYIFNIYIGFMEVLQLCNYITNCATPIMDNI